MNLHPSCINLGQIENIINEQQEFFARSLNVSEIFLLLFIQIFCDGEDVAEHVRRITRAGIPVMGHVGLTPQSVHALGGFKVQGKDDDGAARIVSDALALEQAGAYAVVLEAMPPEVAQRVRLGHRGAV